VCLREIHYAEKRVEDIAPCHTSTCMTWYTILLDGSAMNPPGALPSVGNYAPDGRRRPERGGSEDSKNFSQTTFMFIKLRSRRAEERDGRLKLYLHPGSELGERPAF